MSDKTVIMLLGPSGCGKSTLEKGLCEHEDFRKVISVTTRPIRDGEVDGKDYYFVDQEIYDEMKSGREFIQTTEFAGNCYGSQYAEYLTYHPYTTLCVVPSTGMELRERLHGQQIMDFNVRTVVVYFDISEQRLIENMKARGDTEEMIAKRLADDDLAEQMEQTGIVPDVIITDDTLNENTLTLVQAWLNQLNQLRVHNNG